MFERLTFTAEQREADNLGDAQYFSPEMCAKIDKRLFEYENTGLTPDEIAALRAEVDQYRADIEAGRLVRLPYPIGTNAYVLEREGPLSGRVMPIKVCGYSESDWHGSRNAGKDRHFVICHNSYNEPYAKQLRDVFLTEEAARAALEGGQHGPDQA